MRKVLPKNAIMVPKQAKRVFSGIIYDVYQWQQELFDGSYTTFEMLKRPDTLKVLAVKDNKIIIQQEEQPNHEPFYDIPGGRHDVEGEDELEGSKRELLEETGMTFKTWKLLDVSQPMSKTEQFVYIFLATDFIDQTEQHLDAGEKIKVLYRDFDEVMKLTSSPKARYLPKHILEKANNLEELIALPEFVGVEQ